MNSKRTSCYEFQQTEEVDQEPLRYVKRYPAKVVVEWCGGSSSSRPGLNV